jgi:hypothetical protein
VKSQEKRAKLRRSGERTYYEYKGAILYDFYIRQRRRKKVEPVEQKLYKNEGRLVFFDGVREKLAAAAQVTSSVVRSPVAA